MNKKYIIGLVVILSLSAVQMTVIWLSEASLSLRLFLTVLTFVMVVALVILARVVWHHYQRVTAAIREGHQLFSAVEKLAEQYDGLTREISELSRAREAMMRQQTKLFHFLQEKNK